MLTRNTDTSGKLCVTSGRKPTGPANSISQALRVAFEGFV